MKAEVVMIERFRFLLEEILVRILTICAKIVSKVIRVAIFFNLINILRGLYHGS